MGTNNGHGIWFKHYCSTHSILLVGEGDFSFSACLAEAFGSAPKDMIATSLDSLEFLEANYANAPSNIRKLRDSNCQVLHGVDATKMLFNSSIACRNYDRIIFNFPFAGFFKYFDRHEQIRLHQDLVKEFLRNAKCMLRINGEIHITHKSNRFHNEWGLERLAMEVGLKLIEEVEFNQSDYPGYHTKRGFGGDEDFCCVPSKTYKFGWP